MYPEIDLLYLEDRQKLQDMRDVHDFMSRKQDLKMKLEGAHFPPYLVKESILEHLHLDMLWRSDYLKSRDDFWTLSETDQPTLLSEGISLMSDAAIPLIKRNRALEDSTLSKHPEFEGIQLVRAPFRCFHRADGEWTEKSYTEVLLINYQDVCSPCPQLRVSTTSTVT